MYLKFSNYSLAALLLTLGTVTAETKKEQYQCLEKNEQGECIRETYFEDPYWVATCTAPKGKECTAVMQIGDKRAQCTIVGETCYAKVKAPGPTKGDKS